MKIGISYVFATLIFYIEALYKSSDNSYNNLHSKSTTVYNLHKNCLVIINTCTLKVAFKLNLARKKLTISLHTSIGACWFYEFATCSEENTALIALYTSVKK